MKKNKTKSKNKYYGIYSKSDNFLYGVFPLSEEGHKKATDYITKISLKNKNIYFIKKK
jgi:hypothetical protein